MERRPGIWPAERELLELVQALLEEEERERKERALAAWMRMAKEAVRHGRGRASRTALAGGVRGELGHGLVYVWMIAQLVVMIISISQLILIKVIITWVVTVPVRTSPPRLQGDMPYRWPQDQPQIFQSIELQELGAL